MVDEAQATGSTVSLEAYREFRLDLEGKMIRGEVLPADAERMKHAFSRPDDRIALVSAHVASTSQSRRRALKRARVAFALTKTLLAG